MYLLLQDSHTVDRQAEFYGLFATMELAQKMLEACNIDAKLTMTLTAHECANMGGGVDALRPKAGWMLKSDDGYTYTILQF